MNCPRWEFFPATGLNYAEIPVNDYGAFREYDRLPLERLIGAGFTRSCLNSLANRRGGHSARNEARLS